MKNTNFQKLIVVCAVLILTAAASARSIYIDPNGTGDYPTIRDAVNAAKDGDEVVLADGIYVLQKYGYIPLNRRITVRSENGPENCVIDCNASQQMHRGAFSISSDASIAGITIINAYEVEGGAILCEPSDINPKIINCVLRDNFSEENGGAISSLSSNLTIINCKVTDNSALMGAGIYCEEGQLYVDNCIINDNLTTIDASWTGGGGICCRYGSSLTVINSHITDNIAQGDYVNGGGILCFDSRNMTILNSVISDNICRARGHAEGGGIYYISRSYRGSRCIIAESVIKQNVARYLEHSITSYGGGMYFGYNSQPIITKCIISGNSAVIGAGVYFAGCHSVLDNSVISGNCHFLKMKYQYNQAGGIYCDNSYTRVINSAIVGNAGFGVYASSGSTKIDNSILFGNKYGENYEYQIIAQPSDSVTVSYSNVQMHKPETPPWPGIGNINADPCFINSGYWDSNSTPNNYWDDFWIDGDYHLESASPCIDSGGYVPLMLSNTDLDKKPRIVGSAIDMGAYETRLPAIEVKLFCVPRLINVNSGQKTIIAMLTMPDDIKSDDVDPNEPLFFEPCRVKSKRQMVYQRNWYGKACTYIIAFFDLSDCMEQFSDGPNKVTVKGRLKTGRRYYGTDTIHLVSWKWFRQ
jgi:hypothetical protein